MKSTYLASIVFATVFCACANAQTPPNASVAQSTTPPTSAQAIATHGNDVTDSSQAVPASPRLDPRSDGEDKATGNDLVSPTKGHTEVAKVWHPDFNTLDTKGKGYLTAGDVKGTKWLSKSFARCNTSHNGRLSPEEYANCRE